MWSPRFLNLYKITSTRVMEICWSSTLVQFCCSIWSGEKSAAIGDFKAMSDICARIKYLIACISETKGRRQYILAKGDSINYLYPIFWLYFYKEGWQLNGQMASQIEELNYGYCLPRFRFACACTLLLNYWAFNRKETLTALTTYSGISLPS